MQTRRASVTITLYGRPTVILFSYKEGAELMRLRNAAYIHGYITERQAHVPQDAPELTMEDINKLVHELRT